MRKIQARWKQKSCILYAPKSRERFVVEFVGTYKVRAPTRKELMAAGKLELPSYDEAKAVLKPVSPPSESSTTISCARPREEGADAIQATKRRRRIEIGGDCLMRAMYDPDDTPELDEGQERGDGA